MCCVESGERRSRSKPNRPLVRMFALLDHYKGLSWYYIIGRSKNKGKLAVSKVIALRKSESELKNAEAALEAQLMGEYDEDIDVSDIAEALSDIREKLTRISANIRGRIAALGATERTNLHRLMTNEYVRVRMNARALKQRIRDRLRQRKFELERLEREYRHTVNGEFL